MYRTNGMSYFANNYSSNVVTNLLTNPHQGAIDILKFPNLNSLLTHFMGIVLENSGNITL